MAMINPHINFNGNAEEAFNFYRSVFGGEFTKVIRFKELSGSGFQVPDHEMNKIMLIALPIGNNVLMANDVPEHLGRVNENENRSKISVSAVNRKKLIDYLLDCQPVEILKCQSVTVHGEPILECFEINSELSG